VIRREGFKETHEWRRPLPREQRVEASSGQQLIDVIAASWPNLPMVRAKAVRSKIVRAEAVTPFTTGRSVKLLRADWNSVFIADMANFPASDRDHYTDAFSHGMRCFTGTGSDFKNPDKLVYLPSQRELTEDESVRKALSYL